MRTLTPRQGYGQDEDTGWTSHLIQRSYWTSTAIHHSTARSVRQTSHSPRLTTTEVGIRSQHSRAHLRLQVINIHMPSAIGHAADEIDDTCRRIEDTCTGRRCIRCIMGDFDNVLRSNRDGRTHSTMTVGHALRGHFRQPAQRQHRRQRDTRFSHDVTWTRCAHKASTSGSAAI